MYNNLECQEGLTCFHIAAEKGDISMLNKLLNRVFGASSPLALRDVINQQSDSGNTPLIVACVHKRSQAAEVLLAHGADASLTGMSYHCSSLKNRNSSFFCAVATRTPWLDLSALGGRDRRHYNFGCRYRWLIHLGNEYFYKEYNASKVASRRNGFGLCEKKK